MNALSLPDTTSQPIEKIIITKPETVRTPVDTGQPIKVFFQGKEFGSGAGAPALRKHLVALAK